MARRRREGPWDGYTSVAIAEFMGCSDRTARRYLTDLAKLLGGQENVKAHHIGYAIMQYVHTKIRNDMRRDAARSVRTDRLSVDLSQARSATPYSDDGDQTV